MLKCAAIAMLGAAALCVAAPPSLLGPDRVVLSGPVASQQLVLAGGAAGCVVRSSNAAVARVDVKTLVVHAAKPGTAQINAACGNRRGSVNVEVRNQPAARLEARFSPDVVSVLTIKGCNNSGCHGSPAGQNGFKLSLFGYDVAADRDMIVNRHDGRRVNLAAPEQSLLLRKPLFEIPHGGGRLMTRESEEYKTLLEWLRQGAKLEADGARLTRLEIFPTESVMDGPGAAQAVAVMGRLSDGTTRDMTRQVRLLTSDDSVARVETGGAVVVNAASAGIATVMARGLGQVAALRVGVRRAATKAPAAADSPATSANFIDELLSAQQRAMNVSPAALSSDAEFLRRVYLDVIGRPPLVEETRAFQSNPDRAALIDRLLDQPDYAAFWTVKFEDWFRNHQVNSQGRAMGTFKEWIRGWLAEDRPYDGVVREILTSEGDSFLHPATAFWAPATDFMLKKFEVNKATPTVTRLFLGVRLECAECHNHPLENFTQDDFYGMAAFFARMRVKHGYGEYRRTWYLEDQGDVLHPVTKRPVAPRFLNADAPAATSAEDRRQQLAAWITAPDNPYFSRATVNRIWHEYFQTGIVEPFDDFRLSNPPVNPELLDKLAAHFSGNGFRFKPLHRVILNSRAYQRASRPSAAADMANSDSLERLLFARYQPRKLAAEVLLDSISQVAGVPHTFGGYPPGTRAMDVYQPDQPDYFLVTFGFPRRDILCERQAAPTLGQVLHLMNGKTVQTKVEDPNNIVARWEKLPDSDVARTLYERAFARLPNDAELANATGFLNAEKAAGRTRRKALEGLLWATLVSKEFQINH